MVLQKIEVHFDMNGNAGLQCEAIDDAIPNVRDIFLISTDLQEGVQLHTLIQIIREEFELRYSERSSVFFHAFTFARIVSDAFNNGFGTHRINHPITFVQRERVFEDDSPAPYHPVTAEFNVCRSNNGRVFIDVHSRYDSGREQFFEMETEVIVDECYWDVRNGRVFNHPAAGDYNSVIDEKKEILIDEVDDCIWREKHGQNADT